MKDAELIYSLYVQANPVPDPDLLPLTRDEAALLDFERSPDMINEEQLAPPQPPTLPRSRRIAATLSAAAVLIVAVVAAAILVARDSDAVAAADANAMVLFDGTTCSYEGPTLIEEGRAQFSLRNSADVAFDFTTFRMVETALSHELEEHPIGTDWAEQADAPIPNGEMSFVRVFPPDPYDTTWLLQPGTYLIECTTGDQVGGIPEHVWRIAEVEVVASGSG